jgi:hypothetical protein
MTQRDRWAKRPSVLRYWAFCEELRLKLPRDFDFNHCSITFGIPMPKSWSKKKKLEMDSQPHTQTPDLDNLIKSLLDAHLKDDSGIHALQKVNKVWTREGLIRVITDRDSRTTPLSQPHHPMQSG